MWRLFCLLVFTTDHSTRVGRTIDSVASKVGNLAFPKITEILPWVGCLSKELLKHCLLVIILHRYWLVHLNTDWLVSNEMCRHLRSCW